MINRSHLFALVVLLLPLSQAAAGTPAATAPSKAFETRRKDFDRETRKAKNLRLSASKEKVELHVQHERVVSEVGPLVSVEEDWLVSPCGNSGTVTCHGDDLWATDLSRPGRRASLLDYYSEAQLVAAVKASAQAKQAVEDRAPELAKANSLAAVSKLLVGQQPEFLDENRGADALVTHFGFVRGVDGGVVVRLAPRASWQANGSFDVTLPIPAKLTPAISAAEGGTQGFMIENGPADAGQIEFRWVRPGYDGGTE